MPQAKSPTKSHIPRVLVSDAEGSGDWYRRILQGIAWYVATGPHWEVRTVGMMHETVGRIHEYHPDGVIAVIPSDEAIEPWLKLPCPLVCVGSQREDAELYSVRSDEKAVGRAAAEHLLECRLKNFGFVGFQANPASQKRKQGFLDAIGDVGPVSVLETKHHSAIVPVGEVVPFENKLLQWVEALPRPFGILAWNDITALLVLQACRHLQIPVPEQAAVMGVDDDEVWCGLALPPLTSVRTPNRRCGFQAAAMLDNLINGTEPPQRNLALPPDGVQRRRSTDVLATDDPLVIEALRFIRENIQKRLSVSNVVDAVAVSRRLLEMRFREVLDRSILDEIHRVQLQVAEQMLRNTDVPIRTIAIRAGFRDVNHLTRIFSNTMGLPPAAFRKQSRLG
jgi:LacI family transcriptional regulator